MRTLLGLGHTGAKAGCGVLFQGWCEKNNIDLDGADWSEGRAHTRLVWWWHLRVVGIHIVEEKWRSKRGRHS